MRKSLQRKLVFGYIYEIQTKLKSYSTVYAIPASIINICFRYYYIGDGHIKRAFKTVLLGASGVGKSSIMTRFCKNEYDEFKDPTIGAAFMVQSLIIDEYTVKFEIWDTAGQERFRSLAPMYYRGCSIAIFVLDITNKDSFERAKAHFNEVKASEDNVTYAFVANKSDLKDKSVVDLDEVKKYVQDHESIFMETSAKLNANIHEVFEALGMA